MALYRLCIYVSIQHVFQEFNPHICFNAHEATFFANFMDKYSRIVVLKTYSWVLQPYWILGFLQKCRCSTKDYFQMCIYLFHMFFSDQLGLLPNVRGKRWAFPFEMDIFLQEPIIQLGKQEYPIVRELVDLFEDCDSKFWVWLLLLIFHCPFLHCYCHFLFPNPFRYSLFQPRFSTCTRMQVLHSSKKTFQIM